MLGAADADGDGAVVLDEAYRYAYGATLRSTSRTVAGTQHPAFQYDVRGRGELVRTRPRAHAAERAHFDFPPDLGFMLMRSSAAGPVVVAAESAGKSRTLSLEPGRYFIRARAGRHVSLFSQRFQTRGLAPPRDSLVPFVNFGAAAEANVSDSHGSVGATAARAAHFSLR